MSSAFPARYGSRKYFKWSYHIRQVLVVLLSLKQRMEHEMEEKTIEQLREEAFEALRNAEKAMHAYAVALDVSAARTKAFICFENIRLAWRNA